jgi:hypothetical protein
MSGAVIPLLAYPYISKTQGFKMLDDPCHIGGPYSRQYHALHIAVLFGTWVIPGGHEALNTFHGVSGIGESAQL